MQSDTTVADDVKVRNAIDTLCLAGFDSIKSHEVVDIGFLYDDLTAEGIGSYTYEMGRTALSVANEVYYGLQLASYTYDPEYTSVTIDGDSAIVVMTPFADFIYGGSSGSHLAAEHTFNLVRTSGGWKIKSNNYSDIVTEQCPAGTDFAKIIQSFRKTQDAYKAKTEQWLKSTKNDFKANPRQAGASSVIQSMTGTYLDKTVWAQNLFQAYARYYTEDSHDTTHDTYNTLFREDTGTNDCQNFVSQCIWSMFGATNTQEAIEGRWSPMVGRVPGRGVNSVQAP